MQGKSLKNCSVCYLPLFNGETPVNYFIPHRSAVHEKERLGILDRPMQQRTKVTNRSAA